jgi:hypothetical protein
VAVDLLRRAGERRVSERHANECTDDTDASVVRRTRHSPRDSERALAQQVHYHPNHSLQAEGLKYL